MTPKGRGESRGRSLRPHTLYMVTNAGLPSVYTLVYFQISFLISSPALRVIVAHEPEDQDLRAQAKERDLVKAREIGGVVARYGIPRKLLTFTSLPRAFDC